MENKVGNTGVEKLLREQLATYSNALVKEQHISNIFTQQNVELRQSLKELILIAEQRQEWLEVYVKHSPSFKDERDKNKSAIERAKLLRDGK